MIIQSIDLRLWFNTKANTLICQGCHTVGIFGFGSTSPRPKYSQQESKRYYIEFHLVFVFWDILYLCQFSRKLISKGRSAEIYQRFFLSGMCRLNTTFL